MLLRGAAALGRSRRALHPSGSVVVQCAVAASSSSSSPHARGYAANIPTGGATPTMPGAYCESTEVELGVDKRPVTIGFETGRVARLTDGAVVAHMGDSRVICAAVSAREPDPAASFFPLTVGGSAS